MRIEPLSPAHDREGFSCGVQALDDYLRRFAGQNDRRGIGRTFVLVEEVGARVIGYYTLSAGSVRTDSLPEGMARRLPRYPVPVVLLGRLAVDVASKGKGIGGLLLVNALERAVRVAAEIGVVAVAVVAKDEAARAFYERYGFVRMEDDALHLLLPIETARRLFER